MPRNRNLYRVGKSSLPQFCRACGCEVCATGLIPNFAVDTDATGPALPPVNPARHPNRLASFGLAALVGDPDMRMVLTQVFHHTDEFHSCGSYATDAAALRAIAELNVHVLLTELALPDGCGVHFARCVLARQPEIRVVIASSRQDSVSVGHAAAAGIMGWLTKPFSVDQCLATLRLAAWRPAKPQRPSSPSSLKSLAGPPAGVGRAGALNQRERAVLAALTEGLLYKEIADLIGISEAMVKKLAHQLFGKLHAGNRAEAANQWKSIKSNAHASSTTTKGNFCYPFRVWRNMRKAAP
jgi:DNA-binding NarL/FixJ family response regulator